MEPNQWRARALFPPIILYFRDQKPFKNSNLLQFHFNLRHKSGIFFERAHLQMTSLSHTASILKCLSFKCIVI